MSGVFVLIDVDRKSLKSNLFLGEEKITKFSVCSMTFWDKHIHSNTEMCLQAFLRNIVSHQCRQVTRCNRGLLSSQRHCSRTVIPPVRQ